MNPLQAMPGKTTVPLHIVPESALRVTRNAPVLQNTFDINWKKLAN